MYINGVIWKQGKGKSIKIYILKELDISPHETQLGFVFNRVYLPTPLAPNPHILTGRTLQNLVRYLEDDEAQRIMLDATLTAAQRATHESPTHRPALQGVSSGPQAQDGTHLGFARAVWSPKEATGEDRCFLCVSTYDHQMSLVYCLECKWKTVCDVSALWFAFSSTAGKSLLDEYRNFVGEGKHHNFIAETRFLGVAELLWLRPVQQQAGSLLYSLLVLATTSNHLGLIKVPPYSKSDFKPSVMTCFALDVSLDKITALHWLPLSEKQGFLSVGAVNGSVQICLLSLLKEESSLRCLMMLENNFYGMAVNFVNLVAVDASRNAFCLFVAAHNALLAHLVTVSTNDGEALAFTHKFLGSLAISGLEVINSSLVYLSVKDANIQTVEVEYDLDSPSVVFRGNETVYASEGVHCNGFCFSPNRSFLAVLECVSIPYDHLLLREPNMVNLFQLNSFNAVMQHLVTPQSQPLYEQIDVFESLRLHACREGTRFPHWTLDIASLSPQMKKTHLWIAYIEQGCASKDEQSRKSKEELIEALERNVVADFVRSVVSSCLEEPLPSDPLHQLSLTLMTACLQHEEEKHPLAESTVSTLKKEKLAVSDKCIVCSSQVEFNSIRTARCAQGHTMPRCFRSLVPTTPVLRCVHCHLFYHALASKWYGEVGRTCLLCSRKLSWRVSRKIR